MVNRLSEIDLGTAAGLSKKAKQAHDMDHHQDHPKLGRSPGTGQANATPMQPPLQGGQQ